MTLLPIATLSCVLYNVPPSLSLFLCQLGLQAFSSITACKPRITAARVCLALHASVDHKYTSV